MLDIKQSSGTNKSTSPAVNPLGHQSSDNPKPQEGPSNTNSVRNEHALSNADFSKELKVHFPHTTEERMNDFKNFDKFKIGDSLIIRFPNSSECLQLKDKAWVRIPEPELLKSNPSSSSSNSNSFAVNRLENQSTDSLKLPDRPSITNAVNNNPALSEADFSTALKKHFKDATEERINEYNNFDKFKIGDSLIIRFPNSSECFQLKDKAWVAIEEPALLSGLKYQPQVVSAPLKSDNSTAVQTVEPKVSSTSLGSPSFAAENVSVARPILSALSRLSNLSAFIPELETSKKQLADLLTSSISERTSTKVNAQFSEDPRKALETMEDSLLTYQALAGSLGTDAKEASEINTVLSIVTASKEDLQKPLSHYDNRTYIELTEALKQSYTPDRIESFRQAVVSGNINGVPIDPKRAQFHYEGGLILNALIEGKYNTPSGATSDYGLQMAYTLKYGNLEKDLRQWF